MEVVETVSEEALISAACKESVEEMLLPNSLQEKIKDNFLWVRNHNRNGGVGILLAEKSVEKMFDVNWISDNIFLFKILVGDTIITIPSVNAPQPEVDQFTKHVFFSYQKLKIRSYSYPLET